MLNLDELISRYGAVRQASLALAAPLSAEDAAAQSMSDASPVKWHLAHTTWFFETFLLDEVSPGRTPFDSDYRFLFNSYYNAVGEQYPRPHRGLLTRPDLDTILRYRASVDEAMSQAIESGALSKAQVDVLVLGLHHEQQHQELILTDLLHLLSCNPLYPAYREDLAKTPQAGALGPLHWHRGPEGLQSIGHSGESFAFDNEGPRHEVLTTPHAMASRLIVNAEYRDFIEDGGYTRPELWLADGWAVCKDERWEAPLYWVEAEGAWQSFGLGGLAPVVDAEPVSHISFYEADAYARWAEARLPTEAEWELAAKEPEASDNFVESDALRPLPLKTETGSRPSQLFGDVWEWTASPYRGYPGYTPGTGALGEYNGKFMANQMVLRGGSCVTPAKHIRSTYRNFFPPHARWQWSGLRLTKDT